MLLRGNEAPDAPLAVLDLGRDILLAVRESAGGGARLSVQIGERPADPPYGAVHVPTRTGRTRSFVAFRAPGGRTSAAPILVRDQLDRVLLDLTPAELGPAADPASLLEGLDAEAQGRLLRFLLDFCRRQFRLGEDAAFLALCRGLLGAMQPAARPLRPAARLTARLLLAGGEGRRPAGRPTLLTIDARGARSAALLPRWGEAPDPAAGAPFEVVLDAPAEEGAPTYMVLFASADPLPQVFVCAGAAAAPRYIAQVEAGAVPPATARYVLHGLGRAASDDPQAAALARAVQLARPAEARAAGGGARPVAAGIDLVLGENAGGVFLAGWLSDRHGLVESLELVSPFGVRRLPAEALVRFRRELPARDGGRRRAPEAAPTGFAAHLPGEADPVPVLQYRLRLNLQSGDAIEAVPPARLLDPAAARDAVLASVPLRSLTPEILDRALAPAVRPLHAAAMARQETPDLVEIGAGLARPAVSVLVPLYRNLSFLRFQLAAFAVDRAMREAELVFVLDSPEQREEAEHLLRGLHLLYGLPLRLVVMSGNFGYAAANNTGARFCRGRSLMLLNSDVVPAAPGWLEPLAAALAACPAAGIVGPKLLFDDGSIQHAGMYFDRDARGDWLNRHFYKGYPRDFAPAGIARPVPAVTGAAMLIRRDLYEAVGGFSEDYVIGDYEDSDLCLKVRQVGREVRYAPAAELFHYERQSIRLHAGYARSAASLYNQRLHAARWDTAMAELMRPPGAAARGRRAA